MNKQLFANGAATTLAAALSAGATTIALATGTGALFPTLANGDYFLATLKTMPVAGAAEAAPYEVVKVTAVTGDTITTMQRGFEGTAQAWNLGDKFEVRISASVLNKAVTDATTLIGNPNTTYLANGPLFSPMPGAVVPAPSVLRTLTRFSTAANTLPAGTTADDTSDPIYGASAVRAIVGANTSVVNFPLNSADFAPAVVDCTGTNIRFSFKFNPSVTISESNNMNGCAVRLYNGTNTASPAANYLKGTFGIDRGDRITGSWQTVSIPIEAFTVVGTISNVATFIQNIQFAAIEWNHASGFNSATFRPDMGTVAAVPKQLAKALCILTFDDCRADTFAYAANLMAYYGFPGVLMPGAIQTLLGSNDTVNMNLAQVRKLQDVLGWQIGAQAYTTESPNGGADALTADMSALHNFYRTLGLNGSADGSYFSNVNSSNATYGPVLKTMFRSMREYVQFSDSQTPTPETAPVGDRFKLKCFGVDTANNSGTSLAAYAARAVAQKGVAIYSWHALSSGDTKFSIDGSTLTGFQFFLQWLDQNRATIDVVTTATAFQRMSIG